MKTAVSIPDEVFDAADRAARRLGVSRSEFYARAVARLVDELRAKDVTRRLNDVYAADPATSDSGLDPGLVAAQDAALEDEQW